MQISRNSIFIVIAIIFIGTLALTTHVFILQYFHAPKLEISPHLNQTFNIIIKFCTAVSAFFVYIYSKEYWAVIKPIRRIILFVILVLALAESLFRTFIMNVAIGIFWQYQILSMVPLYVEFLSLAFITCFLVKATSESKRFKLLTYTLLALLTTALLVLLGKIIAQLLAPVLAYIPQAKSEVSRAPYPTNVLIIAYVTYLEPATAAFIVFYLIRDNLTAFSTLVKGLILAGVIFFLHGGIYSILQIIYSTGNIFYRIFYYGQFLWEYLTLGLLTAYSFKLLQSLGANRVLIKR